MIFLFGSDLVKFQKLLTQNLKTVLGYHVVNSHRACYWYVATLREFLEAFILSWSVVNLVADGLIVNSP